MTCRPAGGRGRGRAPRRARRRPQHALVALLLQGRHGKARGADQRAVEEGAERRALVEPRRDLAQAARRLLLEGRREGAGVQGQRLEPARLERRRIGSAKQPRLHHARLRLRAKDHVGRGDSSGLCERRHGGLIPSRSACQGRGGLDHGRRSLTARRLIGDRLESGPKEAGPGRSGSSGREAARAAQRRRRRRLGVVRPVETKAIMAH